MSKSKRCVHCGTETTEITMDHVFPASWYPANTPSNMNRWTVPSCRRCNGVLGKKEKELFARLAMCVDPRKAEAAGLSAKALRSMGIGTEGLDDKEYAHRRALMQKVLGSARPYQPGTETLPGLGPHPGFPEDQQMAVSIPADLVEAVTEKIVCGSEYALMKRIVDEPYDVRVYFVQDQNVPEVLVQALQGPAAQSEHLGPGFRLLRIAPRDEPNTVIYKITIWDTFVFFGAIMAHESPEVVLGRTDESQLLPGGPQTAPTSSKVGVSAFALFRAVAVVALLGLGLSWVLMVSRAKSR